MLKETDCELCALPGGELLWENGLCRVVRVTDASGQAFPGSCRIILKRHVAEMSELDAGDARRLMDTVLATERALAWNVALAATLIIGGALLGTRKTGPQ